MSVFNILKNNQGRDDVGLYMAYSRYEELLLQAQQEERDRILNAIQDIENLSHKTRTPLFQETLLELVRKAIDNKPDSRYN